MCMPLTYKKIVKQSLALPDVVESTSYGTAALKVGGKLMIRLKEDGETIVIRTTWEERERLLTVYPEGFFLTDHDRNYPWVLLRLESAKLSLFRPVLHNAWRLTAPKALLKAYPLLPK